jgi:hypothetical protein
MALAEEALDSVPLKKCCFLTGRNRTRVHAGKSVNTKLKVLAVLCLLSGGGAWAAGKGHENDGAGGYGAPEPVTVVGLALGAGATGLMAWRKLRRR